MPAPDPDQREHDVVVYGASGFVGVLTAKYLLEQAPSGTRIALGGRSKAKLERTRESLGGGAADWPLVVADSQDQAAVEALAASTRVVATTVGPYVRWGLPLVVACARAGTHYADLCGEVLFMRRAIDAAHDVAVGTGARIVHACGFDSIPSDLGVLLLHEAAAAGGHGDLQDTTLVVEAMRGGASGGTIDSLRTSVDEGRRDPAVGALLADPYGLSPDRANEPDLGPEGDPVGAVNDRELGGWLAPFLMGTINTRVVRRSNALQGHVYGRSLRYRELMSMGRGPLGAAKAAGVAGAMAGFQVGLAFPPARAVLDLVLPSPGEGPDEAAREAGFFEIATHARTAGGARLRCEMRAQGDPGYKATAVMFGESALALAFDGERLPERAGVLTPATAMGTVLADRLRAAGHRYDVVTS